MKISQDIKPIPPLVIGDDKPENPIIKIFKTFWAAPTFTGTELTGGKFNLTIKLGKGKCEM
jgi:hypothetical protein